MKSIYSIRAIVWLAFLGFPLAGAVATSSNFKTFGKKGLALGTLLFGVLLTMVVYFTFAHLPEELPATSIIYLLFLYFLFAAGTGFYAVKTQGSEIQQYLQAGGTKKGVLRSIGLLVVSFVLQLIVVLISFSLFPVLLPSDFAY